MSDLQIVLSVLVPFGLTGIGGLWYLAWTLSSIKSDVEHMKEAIRYIWTRLGGQSHQDTQDDQPRLRIVK